MYNCRITGMKPYEAMVSFRCLNIETAMTRLRLRYRNKNWINAYVAKEHTGVVVAHMLNRNAVSYFGRCVSKWAYV